MNAMRAGAFLLCSYDTFRNTIDKIFAIYYNGNNEYINK